ncbi:TPA: hypothetical protein ACKRTE_001231 [Providencia rettgeri]
MNKTVIALILTPLTGYQAVGPNYEPPQATLPDNWGASQQVFSLARGSDLNGARDFIHVLSTPQVLLDLQSTQIISQEETPLAVVNLYRARGGGGEQTYPSNTQQENIYAQHNE